MLTASVKLITPAREIRQKVMNSLVKEINKRYRAQGGGRQLKLNIQEALRKTLLKNPTVQALLSPGSELVVELGLTDLSGSPRSDPTPRIEQVIDTIVKGVNVGFHPFTATPTGNIAGKVSVWGIPYDHSDVLSIDAAQQINYDEKGRLSQTPFLPWLEWLLTYGSQVIVTGFYIWKNAPEEALLVHSRTGYAVMAKRKGTGWTVPAEHQGQLGNNFITQAVDSLMNRDIPKILKKAF